MLNEQLLQHLSLQDTDNSCHYDSCMLSLHEEKQEPVPDTASIRYDPSHIVAQPPRNVAPSKGNSGDVFLALVADPLLIDILCVTMGFIVATGLMSETAFFYRQMNWQRSVVGTDTLLVVVGIVTTVALKSILQHFLAKTDVSRTKRMQLTGLDARWQALRCRVSEQLGAIGATPLDVSAFSSTDTIMSEEHMKRHEDDVMSFMDPHTDLVLCLNDVLHVLRLGTALQFGVLDRRQCDSISVERIESTSLIRLRRNHQGMSERRDDSASAPRRSFSDVSMPLLRRHTFTLLQQHLLQLQKAASGLGLLQDGTELNEVMVRSDEPAIVTLTVLRSMKATLCDYVSTILNGLCDRTIVMDKQAQTMIRLCGEEATCCIAYLNSALSASSPSVSTMAGTNSTNSWIAHLDEKLNALRHQAEMMTASILSQQESDPDTRTWGVLRNLLHKMSRELDDLDEEVREDESSCEDSVEAKELDLGRTLSDQRALIHENDTDTRQEVREEQGITEKDPVTVVFSGVSLTKRRRRPRNRPSSAPLGESSLACLQQDIFNELREGIQLLPQAIEKLASQSDCEVDMLALDDSGRRVPETTPNECSTIVSSNDSDLFQSDTSSTGKGFLGELQNSLAEMRKAPADGTTGDLHWGD